MERVIERTGSGLGDGIGFLADSGVLFVLFALVWIGLGVALVWSEGSVEAVWTEIRSWPLVLEGIMWVAFLPVMAAMWVWESSWPMVVRWLAVAGLAAWTLLIFPKPWE